MSREVKLKTFVGNFDGRRKGLIRASSVVKAAAVAGCSPGYFRQFWGVDDRIQEEFEVDVLYTRKIGSMGDAPWVKGRCVLG